MESKLLQKLKQEAEDILLELSDSPEDTKLLEKFSIKIEKFYIERRLDYLDLQEINEIIDTGFYGTNTK